MAGVLRAEKIAASGVVSALPRGEYPRPSLVRSDWICLNGEWEFAFDDADAGISEGWNDGRALPMRITVPFAYQYPLSGIGDRAIHEVVWYARSIDIPDAWWGKDLLLHFGAVDYETTVWVNGQEIGRNQGGHTPFDFDIAPYVHRGGANRLIVRVVDRQLATQPRGKQSVTGLPTAVDYYCTTGIWQPVWIEPVPQMRISDLQIKPRIDIDGEDGAACDALDIRVYLHAPALAWTLLIDIMNGEEVIAEAQRVIYGAGTDISIVTPPQLRWSPSSPHLHDIRIRLMQGDVLMDEIFTYAGVRAVTLAPDGLYFNAERLYQKLVLDQGYWPDGGMTGPTDEALRADVEWALRYGYNGVRKHQKVEDPRWLFWCDKLGLLVWGEMANARDWSILAEEHFLREWERAVRRDYNHPCIVVWVPLNESWGVPGLREDHATQYAFVERIVAVTRRLDLTRPVVDNDGWEHTDITDILAIHDYTPSGAGIKQRYACMTERGELPPLTWGEAGKSLFTRGSKERGQPVMLTEIGGLLMMPPDTPPEKLDGLYFAYGTLRTPEEFGARYEDVLGGVAELGFVSGFCYTQLTDIEQEQNGLLTYDRRPKVDPEQIRALHERLFR